MATLPSASRPAGTPTVTRGFPTLVEFGILLYRNVWPSGRGPLRFFCEQGKGSPRPPHPPPGGRS
eukprot:7059575-Prymnesium_polylepis.1